MGEPLPEDLRRASRAELAPLTLDLPDESPTARVARRELGRLGFDEPPGLDR